MQGRPEADDAHLIQQISLWVASLDDNAGYGSRPDGSVIGAFDGGGIYGPWDVTIDGDDNLWVANFGPIEANNTLAAGRLSKLCFSDCITPS